MDSREMADRTARFSLRVVKLYFMLERGGGDVQTVIGKQLLRSATSVGANYRAACHAKSRSDFIAKIKICEEESDESEYWLELLVNAGVVDAAQVQSLRDEAHEITSILIATAKKAMNRKEE